jgi:hypothetical protein
MVEKKLWWLFLAFLGLALGAAMWGWLLPARCGSCDGANALLGGMNLAPLGVAYYSIILGAAVLLGPCTFAFSGATVAATVHAVLLFLLFQRGVLCPPCIVAGLAAIGGMTVSFFMDAGNIGRASVTLPIAAFASHLALFALGVVTPRIPPGDPPAAVREDLHQNPDPQAGRAKMVIYTRSGCSYCEELERDVLPRICRTYESTLAVERRAAPEGLPTPTIVVTGKVRTVFPGLPPEKALERAVALAVGGNEHASSVLPKP